MSVLTLWPHQSNGDPAVRWEAYNKDHCVGGLIVLPFLSRELPLHEQLGQALLYLLVKRFNKVRSVIKPSALERGRFAIETSREVVRGLQNDLKNRTGRTAHSVFFAVEGHVDRFIPLADEPLWHTPLDEKIDDVSLAESPVYLHHHLLHDTLGRIRITPHAIQRVQQRLPGAPKALSKLIAYLQRMIDSHSVIIDSADGNDNIRTRRALEQSQKRHPSFTTCFVLSRDPQSGAPVRLVVSKLKDEAFAIRAIEKPHKQQNWFLATLY